MSETTEEELKAAEGETPELVAGVRVAYTKPTAEQVMKEMFFALLTQFLNCKVYSICIIRVPTQVL